MLWALARTGCAKHRQVFDSKIWGALGAPPITRRTMHVG